MNFNLGTGKQYVHAILVAAILLGSGCKKHSNETIVKPLSQDITKIDIGDGPISVYVEHSDIPYISYTDWPGTAEVTASGSTVSINNTISDFTIGLSSLDGIKIASNGSVVIGDVKINSLSVELMSNGNVEFEKPGPESLTLTLTYESLNAIIHSNGTFSGYGRIGDHAYVNVKANGRATVHVTQSLHANLLGAIGNIKYKGNPQITLEKGNGGALINDN